MMRIQNRLVWVGLMWFVPVASAEQPATGARALYYDPQTQMTIGTSTQRDNTRTERALRKDEKPKQNNARKDKPAPTDTDAGTTTAATATGVKYYMELLGEHGQLLRVNSNRVFHSGERFRLKLESNVDGRLTIVQSQNEGALQRLFPDVRVRGGSDRIQARVTTALPSETGWFRFDEHPGEIRLLVMVVPDPPVGPVTPSQSGPGVATSPMVASRDVAAEAAAITAAQRRGSRALVVEEDTSPVEPATYAVALPQRRDDPGEIAIEIRLRHEH